MNSIPSIALSGMNAAQTALGVAGHNIANLGTTGFRRQQVVQQADPSGGTAASVEQALQPGNSLESDAVVKSWFSPNLWQTYIAVKRKEIELMANLGPDEICERYRNAY